MISLTLKIQFSLGPYFISTSTEHYSRTSYICNFMTCMVYHFKPCIWRKETSCQIKSDNQLFCNVVFTPPLFQRALQNLPLQLLTNKSENAWLLCINMETHLFKEKRRETFHVINSKRWSYCSMNFYGEILHWCISVFKINTGNKHDITIVSPREQ